MSKCCPVAAWGTAGTMGAWTLAGGMLSVCILARKALGSLRPRRFWWSRYLISRIEHTRAGVPFPTDVVLRHQGYAVGYSFALRSPLWASYFVTARSLYVQSCRCDNVRSESFVIDPELPRHYALSPEQMNHPLYDKGHLAPRAAVAFSDSSARESFYLSNAALQHPHLNRRLWKRMEGLVRYWAAREGRVAVVCGPVFAGLSAADAAKRNPKAPALVPTHFYVALLGMESYESFGLLVTNDAKPKAVCLSVPDLEARVHKLSSTSGIGEARVAAFLPWWLLGARSRRRQQQQQVMAKCRFFKQLGVARRCAIATRKLFFGAPDARYRVMFEHLIANRPVHSRHTGGDSHKYDRNNSEG